MTMDSDGFFYFADRVGDTFRWKSENVSTMEVARVIGMYPDIDQVNVYGTLVPLHDGRAGMAVIALHRDTSLDFSKLYAYLSKKLPSYAIPQFLRLVDTVEITSTFKQNKALYRKQGINLSVIPPNQTVYWLRGKTYVPFTLQDYEHLQMGKVHL